MSRAPPKRMLSSCDVMINGESLFENSMVPKYRFKSKPARLSTDDGHVTVPSYNLLAILEGRGKMRGHIGLAVYDLRVSDVTLYQFIDSSGYNRLKATIFAIDPIEVVVPQYMEDSNASTLLLQIIKNCFRDTTISAVQTRHFSEACGMCLVRQLSNPEISNFKGDCLQKNKLAACAVGALLKYVEFIQHIIFVGTSLRMTFHNVEEICSIDYTTCINLEIVNSSNKAPPRSSLVSLINYTQTSGGARLLRSNVLQPLANKERLNTRLDAVEEVLFDEHLLDRLRKVMGCIFDLDQPLAVCYRIRGDATLQLCETNIVNMQRLRHTLATVPALLQSLRNVKSKLLVSCREILEDPRIAAIVSILDQYLAGIPYNSTKNCLATLNRKLYALRSGISVTLDVARRAFEELTEELYSCERVELDKYLPKQTTRLAYSATRKFHYVWSCKDPMNAKLPHPFISPVRHRSSLTFTSHKLVKFNDRITQAVAEVMLSSNAVMQELFEQIRPLVPAVYSITDVISTVDFIVSLATYSNTIDCVRPSFGNVLLFKDGKHPLLLGKDYDAVVSNDTYLTPESQFAVITGPNMAGKSTYLKQLCHLTLLAQIGCFVPAETAIIPVFTHIFSRVGHNDDLHNSLSAFALEMKEMAYILRHASPSTFVVIDELGRSTSVEEGLSVSYAITEALLRSKTYGVLATHFLDLVTLDVDWPCLENLHFAPQIKIINNMEVVYPNHKLEKGPYNGPIFGFELVQLSTIPQTIIDAARELAEKLKAENDAKIFVSWEAVQRRLMIRTACRLRNALTLREAKSKEEMTALLKQIKSNLQSGIEEVIAYQEWEQGYEEDGDIQPIDIEDNY